MPNNCLCDILGRHNVKIELHNLIEKSTLHFNKKTIEYMTEKFTETKNFVALEDFVMMMMNTVDCDVDYLFYKLVDAHKSNPDKMFDILDYIEEMNHVASEELKSQILKIIQDGDLEIPESLKMKFSPITKRTL